MVPATDRVVQYSLRTPAYRFRQGGRDVYSFTLDLATLDNLLPERVDARLGTVEDAQRPLTPAHATRIQDYLTTQDNWLLGTLLLGIAPEAVDFRSYQGDSADAVQDVGELRLRSDCLDTMKMFDGQHRRRAIKDALRQLSQDGRRVDKVAALRASAVPIMLYAEGSIDALRQMFADASRTKPIERNTVARFDLQDAFNVAALWLSESSDLLSGRVEMERASVARTSENIISINQLAMALKTLMVGYKGRVSKDLNSAYLLNPEELHETCWIWADDFLPAAREEYDALLAGEVDNSEIPQQRSGTMAYNATVIRLLAGCYYEWLKDEEDWQPLADFIRSTSLEPGKREDALLVDAGLVIPGGTTPIARAHQVARAIDYIVSCARESNG